MDENSLKLLRELKQMKNEGDLDTSNLDFDSFEKYLKHQCEEVRLVALALLVESKKSTQRFTKIHLDLITIFLKYNLGERMEYVPLIKKALKRMKESLAVLKRNIAKDEKMKEYECQVDINEELYKILKEETFQLAQESLTLVEIYKKFFYSFREICIQGLCPGSTNYRKKYSLQMLCLGQEFLEKEFEDAPWTIEQADKLFECLLLDTYEINKEIIYKIAKSMDARLLRLDDPERVHEIIDVALDLANCIRPIDSITASYMLKISLLSPVINNILEKYPSGGYFTLGSTELANLRLIEMVIQRLKDPLRLAEENIVTAAGKHSLYGYLFCIKSLLSICDLRKVSKNNPEPWTRTVSEIIKISFRLNNAVSQIVNNSSPEGHLPMDMESSTMSMIFPENNTSTVTPQMVLLCSWRTVKEVSLLFGYLSSKSPITGDNAEIGLLNEKQLIEIGEHLVTLLFETKHRGAFEQAYVGFGQLCNRLWRSSHENLKKLPKIWLHHLLLAVSGLSTGNAKLCATRRSAGVPFMVQALVSSDPCIQNDGKSAVFHSVIKILLGFTDLEEGTDTTSRTKSLMYEETIFSDLQEKEQKIDENGDLSKKNLVTITEIKTHALNILRALFKNAQLGDLSRNYAAEGLCAAIRSYDGKTWAERNAATLLFSSLITRIFGVQRTKDHENLTLHNMMTGRIFFERYPSLLTFMLEELRAFVDSGDTLIKPSVQSILLLLSRLYPSFSSDEADTKWKIDDFIKLVSACAKSRVYKTRELAARALVPLLTEKTVQSFMLELFERIIPGGRNGSFFNALHGYMLQILEITKSPHFKIQALPREQIENYLSSSKWIFENLQSDNNKPACFPLASAYLIVVRRLVEAGFVVEEMKRLLHRLTFHLENENFLKKRPGREIYELEIVKFFIATMENRFFEEFNNNRIWKSALSHENSQVQIAAWPKVAGIIDEKSDQELLEVAKFACNEVLKKDIELDLQDAIYDYRYHVLILEKDKFFSPGLDESCVEVVTALVEETKSRGFQKTPNYFRLLGKAYGTLSMSFKNHLSIDDKQMIYKIFLDNTWMCSADLGQRIAISKILDNLYINEENLEFYLSLDWWTSLLNLLVDDNIEVRNNASEVVKKLLGATELECISAIMEKFFNLFISRMRQNQNAIFAAFFVWSTSLSGDADYEMDESDVFNKCYNYEIFEPLRISELCHEKLKLSLENFSMDDEFSLDLREWLSERLCNTIDVEKFKNARELVTEYGKTIPRTDTRLKAVMDPMNNDKLLQVMAHEKFVTILDSNL